MCEMQPVVTDDHMTCCDCHSVCRIDVPALCINNYMEHGHWSPVKTLGEWRLYCILC